MSLLITFMYSFKFKDLIFNSPFSLFCDFLRQLREFGALSSWHCQTDKLPILVIFFHGRGGGGVWLEMVSEVPYWLHMGVKEKHFYFYVNNSMQVFIALDMIYFFLSCGLIAVPEKPKTWAALAASRTPPAQSSSAPSTNSRPVRQAQQVAWKW